MIHILVGTDRVGSNSQKVAILAQSLFKEVGVETEVLELKSIADGLKDGSQYGAPQNPILKSAIDKIESSEGILVVVPEYNGSVPGILKHFIDHWKYPESFEHRPVAFIGIGGMFGGLRPVEHLQQIFGYRNAFIFPDRIFIMNVWNHFKVSNENPNGTLKDPAILDLLKKQVSGFSAFVKALRNSKLHALDKTKK